MEELFGALEAVSRLLERTNRMTVWDEPFRHGRRL